MSDSTPTLDLAALLATKTFDEDDLAHTRRGALSARQIAWCKENPRFVDVEDGDTTVEPVMGRVVTEGRHAVDITGQTIFAQLVVPGGDTFSLRPGLKRALVRDAPYRAYAAHGWIWSIEPIAESELGPAATGDGPYRTASLPVDDTVIARALQDALATELAFSRADVKANRAGRFSKAQRAKGRRMLLSASARLVIACIAIVGLVWLLVDGAPFPVMGTIVGLGALAAALLGSIGSFMDAVAFVFADEPARAIARLEENPNNKEQFILESEARPLKLRRAALTIEEAASSTFRGWRYEVYFVPRSRNIVTVRPLRPRAKKSSDASGEEGR